MINTEHPLCGICKAGHTLTNLVVGCTLLLQALVHALYCFHLPNPACWVHLQVQVQQYLFRLEYI